MREANPRMSGGEIYQSARAMVAAELQAITLAERHVAGSMVGETLRAVRADQFRRLRDGDRFCYQHYLEPALVSLVEAQTLAVIIRRNTGIGTEIPDDVFRVPAPQARHTKLRR